MSLMIRCLDLWQENERLRGDRDYFAQLAACRPSLQPPREGIQFMGLSANHDPYGNPYNQPDCAPSRGTLLMQQQTPGVIHMTGGIAGIGGITF